MIDTNRLIISPMTETVKALKEWIFENRSVNSIIAETDISNIPSQKVLINNRFIEYKKTDSELWWRVQRDTTSNNN